MPPIPCRACGQRALVLSSLALKRHCPACGAVLVPPMDEGREQLTARVREVAASGRAMLRYGEGLLRPQQEQLQGSYFSGLGFRTTP